MTTLSFPRITPRDDAEEPELSPYAKRAAELAAMPTPTRTYQDSYGNTVTSGLSADQEAARQRYTSSIETSNIDRSDDYADRAIARAQNYAMQQATGGQGYGSAAVNDVLMQTLKSGEYDADIAYELGRIAQQIHEGYNNGEYDDNTARTIMTAFAAATRRRTPRITPPRVGEAGLASPNGNPDGYYQTGGFDPNVQLDPSQINDMRGMNNLPPSPYPGPEMVPTPTAYVNQITPPNVGNAGLAAMSPPGPEGRTLAEIQASGDYLSEAEREFFLNSIGKTIDPNTGQAVPMPPPTDNGPQSITPPSGESLFGQPPAPAPAPTPAPTGMRSTWTDWGEAAGGGSLGFGALGRTPYAGQTSFSPVVEQWRPLVEKYFQPQDVNKALYVISGESSGKSVLQYDRNGNQVGPAAGLFQIEGGEQWPGRPTMQQLLDPETNVAYAAKLVYRR